MNSVVRRTYVEKKSGYDIEARALYKDLKYNLGIKSLKSLRIINRYDLQGISDEIYEKIKNTILSELPLDEVWDGELDFGKEVIAFGAEFLPGQYDQRADSAAQCIQIVAENVKPIVRTARLYLLEGDISDNDLAAIKKYCINPVDSRESSLEIPSTLEEDILLPPGVEILQGFTAMDEKELKLLYKKMALAMSYEDLAFCREYFRDTEKRDPFITEIRVIDTYWSDHCRHTTFLTSIEEVDFEDGQYTSLFTDAYHNYLDSRKYVYNDRAKEVCLMDIATIAMKEFRKKGMLDDLEVSDEINACSIIVKVDYGEETADWLVMFKNETHNHPTEIEPFGGAATCLGGAIRDPLSGRSYVYQAMRVTGSGDPRAKVEDTLPGKLPQIKITTGAAAGYSSYGNQIGIATGQVSEIYDEGYVAKRMEIGAVIGAAPRSNVKRERPVKGDVVVLVGGRTGRDGCGGATGSSKEHTEESLVLCGAEVQKGNPVTERKIQRLFRKPEVSLMIKKCNDFGAGGVSVAIGELAEGLEINLDAVLKKYEGLDGTELAISESQERMAVVLDKSDTERFFEAVAEENLEAAIVAEVTDSGRLGMYWRNRLIVDIDRDFLNTNGVRQRTGAYVKSPAQAGSIFYKKQDIKNIKAFWLDNLAQLNVCSQKGLVERFDSSIGASTVLMPFGGRYQLSPSEGMAAKIPLLDGETDTCTLMAHGYNPLISKWSPFHGAVYSIIEAVSRITAMGGDIKGVRLSLQEYFEKLGKDPVRWGKPFSALLGAYFVQEHLGIPAIGGKDSMSGTFRNIDVPPALVAFAVGVYRASKVISTDFKNSGNKVVTLELFYDNNDMPDFEQFKRNCELIHKLNEENRILSAHSIRAGGVAEAVSKMCFGNRVGFEFDREFNEELLFKPLYGSFILEICGHEDIENIFAGVKYKLTGKTSGNQVIRFKDCIIGLDEAIAAWTRTLEKVFPTTAGNSIDEIQSEVIYSEDKEMLNEKYEYQPLHKARSSLTIAQPRVFIPVFPGTNCEYDTKKAFEKAGAKVEQMVFRNIVSSDIEKSIRKMTDLINSSQIIMIPGGFSAGDEPEGSGKFIAAVFRSHWIEEAVMKLLKERDGLILGICNGFQALIKLGLVPWGEIRNQEENSPTLTFNTIGRHVSCMVRTRITSTLSPWLYDTEPGEIHTIPVSHGEGRFVAKDEDIRSMLQKGQIATRYVDNEGNPSMDIKYNPNGSIYAIEGITSPDGKILGKMAHSERTGKNIAINVPGEKDQKLFRSGVKYFQ